MTFKATTILAVRKDNRIAMGGDGQVTLGNEIVKHSARKVRTLADGKILVGFAGSAADAFALMERFEKRLAEYNNNLIRAANELAKEWRMDKALRQLESMMIAADRTTSLLLGGRGDIIESDDGILAIGSGGGYAAAAGRALLRHSTLSAPEIVKESLLIAGTSCIYTNTNINILELTQ